MSLSLALLLMLAPVPVEGAPIEGAYVAQTGKTATALELEPGGRYRWLYSQDALDLTSEGKWLLEGGAIVLASDPVTPPSFALLQTSASGEAGLVVQVLTSSGEPIPAVEVRLRSPTSGEHVGQTDANGQHRFALSENDLAEHVVLGLPAFELRSQEFRTAAKAGRRLVFQIEANDLGKQVFAGERLSPAGGGFRLSFRGRQLDYQRQEGGIEEVP